MSFGGHVIDMINRMKANRAQRPSNRSKFKENNRSGIYNEKTERLQFKTVSEKELIEIKKQIRLRAKAEKRKELIIYGIVIVSFVIITFVLLK